jgi:hypothetical protein
MAPPSQELEPPANPGRFTYRADIGVIVASVEQRTITVQLPFASQAMRDQQVLCKKASEPRACKHDRFFGSFESAEAVVLLTHGDRTLLSVKKSEMSKWTVMFLVLFQPFFDLNQAMVRSFNFPQYLPCVWILLVIGALMHKPGSHKILTTRRHETYSNAPRCTALTH